MKMQERQRTGSLGSKFRKLGQKNEEHRKLANQSWSGTPPNKPTSVDSKHRRIPKVDPPVIQKMKRAEASTNKKNSKDTPFRPTLNKRQLVQVKTESKTQRKFPSDGLQSLKQNIIGDWDKGRKLTGCESGPLKPKVSAPCGFDNLSSTKCSFKVALIQKGRRLRRLPKIAESVSQEKLLNKKSESNIFVLQSTQDSYFKTYNKPRRSGDLKQANWKDCFKPEFDAIMQNDKKIELLEAKLKKLSLNTENRKKETIKPNADGSLEKGINDIQISLSELNGILTKIKSSKTCAYDHQEGESSEDIIRSTVELTNLMEVVSTKSVGSVEDENLKSSTTEIAEEDVASVKSNESMHSLNVNVHSETNYDLSDCTQLQKSTENLVEPTTEESAEPENRIANWDEARWKMIQRQDNFENQLTSQVALMEQKEITISKLQGKLREMTEDLQNTCQERIDFAFQSKQLFDVYEGKLQELYKCCKLAEEEMHCLRTDREKLVDTLREQVGVQANVDGIFEAYQHVLREKEAMKVEMRNLFGFLVEQGKSMDNLRATVKTMTEQLDNMRHEFQQQNDKLAEYYETNFKEFNNDREDLEKRIQQTKRRQPASLTLLSACEIETFSCRSITPT